MTYEFKSTVLVNGLYSSLNDHKSSEDSFLDI